MDKLKERLEPLQLNYEQKQKILAKTKRPKKQFAFIPIIFPTFIVVTLLIAVLSTMPTNVSNVTTAGAVFNKESLPLRYIILTSISSLEVIIIYFLLKLNFQKTIRWQHNAFIQELYAAITKPGLVVTVIVVLMGMMWFGMLYTGNRLYAEGVFVGCSYFLLLLIYFYSVRKMERTACPHCGVKLTRRQIIVKTMMQYRERCNSCKHLIYLTKESKQQMIALFIWPIMPIWIGNMASLHTGLVICFCLLNVATFIFAYVPVMVQFTKENTDPEKLS